MLKRSSFPFLNSVLIFAAASLALAAAPSPGGKHQEAAAGELVYVGTNTNGTSRGIYAYRFNPATGDASFQGLEAATPNPTFLAVARDGHTLYAVNEEGNAGEGDAVSAFHIDHHSARLKFLNKVSSAGIGPCDLAIAHKASFLLVSNCGSGSVALLPLLPDGSLAPASSVVQHHGSSVNPRRQSGPHAHGLALSLDDRFAFVADLGTDKVSVHPIGSQGLGLSPGNESVLVAPGGGVRHLALDPTGRSLYSIDEIDSALTTFRVDGGKLKKIHMEFALPTGALPQPGGSELALDPSGQFLYVSIRGAQDKIGAFSIDPHSGVPHPFEFIASEGKMPRHFALDLTGSWLAIANQKSHSILWIRRNQSTGRLQSIHDQSDQIDSPMCIAFVPAA